MHVKYISYTIRTNFTGKGTNARGHAAKAAVVYKQRIRPFKSFESYQNSCCNHCLGNTTHQWLKNHVNCYYYIHMYTCSLAN